MSHSSLPILRSELQPIGSDAAQYLTLAQDAYHSGQYAYGGMHSEPALLGWRWFPLLFKSSRPSSVIKAAVPAACS